MMEGSNLLYKAHAYTRSELVIVSRHIPLGAVNPNLPQAVPCKISVFLVSNDTDQRQYDTCTVEHLITQPFRST
jgi:hypothetical protein